MAALSIVDAIFTHGVQRRQLTVLFCDLVNSTELSLELDAEEVLEITNSNLRFFAKCAEEAGGFVARFAGDGVLVYFGYPQASEDDPARAVSCALTIRDGRSSLSALVGRSLDVRIGIATGAVVVGDLIGSGPSREYSVVGKTPNLAARLQSAAAANTILVCDETRKRCAGLFRFEYAGPMTLKGLPSGTEVWKALGTNDAVDAVRVRRREVWGRMMGRDAELGRLLETLRYGEGARVMGLIGEPGIGKSRLLQETRKAMPATRWIECAGVQLHKDTSFYVAAQMVWQGISQAGGVHTTTDGPGPVALLRAIGMDDDDVSLLADLLGQTVISTGQPLTMRPKEKRRRLIATLVKWTLNTAVRSPLVVAIEDLQWVDPSTIEFVGALARQMRPVALHLVYTAREDPGLRWPPGLLHESIPLRRLSDAECRLVVEEIAAGNVHGTAIDRIVSRSQGVPLFAEELARHVIERGDGDPSAIPDTLSALLMVRLHRLGTAATLIRIASVLGMEFPLPLLQAVSHRAQLDFQSALQALVDAEMLTGRDDSSLGTCRFRHALIRDAAYESMLKSQRRELHREIAVTISERFADLARPEILAQHWTAAGDAHRAIEAWQDAGRSAGYRRAYTEAQRAYESAIALFCDLPASTRRDQRELELRSAYAGVLQITMGYSAPETIAATEIARQLAGKAGDLRKQCAHIAGAWMAASSAGDYALAMRLADQLMPFALAEISPDGLGIAYMIQMTSRYRTGDLIGAEESFASGSNFFASAEFQQRPGAAAQTFGNAAVNAWLLDELEQARERSKTCLEICQRSGNPYDLAFGQQMAAMSALLMDEPGVALPLAEQSIHISDRNGFPQFAATSRIVMGRAETQLGDIPKGLSLMLDGVERMTSNSSRNGITMYLSWLAEAEIADGRTQAGLATLERALQVNPQETFFRPEALRLRAVARSRTSEADADADCREAIALAGRIGARLLHARAVATMNSLARAREKARRARAATTPARPLRS